MCVQAPAGLELDANGNLYVCDRENNVIRVITSATPGRTIQLPVAPYDLPGLPEAARRRRAAAGDDRDLCRHRRPRLRINGDRAGARHGPLLAAGRRPSRSAASVPEALLRRLEQPSHPPRRDRRHGHDRGRLRPARRPGRRRTGRELNHPTDIAFHPATGASCGSPRGTRTRSCASTSTPAGDTQLRSGNRRGFEGDGRRDLQRATGGPPSLAELNMPASVKFTATATGTSPTRATGVIRKVDARHGHHQHDRRHRAPIAGVTQPGFAGDGGPALGAMFNMPGRTVGPAGRARISLSPDEHWLYIADTNNHRIRRIDLTRPAAHDHDIRVRATGTPAATPATAARRRRPRSTSRRRRLRRGRQPLHRRPRQQRHPQGRRRDRRHHHDRRRHARARGGLLR